MNEGCNDVEIEPKLQPLQGESFANNSTTTEYDARLDIKANGKLSTPMPKHREICIKTHTNITKR